MSIQTAPKNQAKHERLSEELRRMARELAPGDRFPSHIELMRRFGVSDRTALRSLDDLRRENLIVRRNGIGTFVAEVEAPAGSGMSTSVPPVSAPGGTLAVLAVPSSSYFQRTVQLLTHTANDAGFAVVCHYLNDTAPLGEALPLEAVNPVGFLVFSYLLAPMATLLQKRGHRVVIIGVPPANLTPTIPTVFGDHEHGGYLAARRLTDLGHRQIAFAYETEYGPVPVMENRRVMGHRRALREAGITGDVNVIHPATWAEWKADPKTAARYFARPDAPTGIAVWNDHAAGSLETILWRAGMTIPDDVSLIGYDNLPGTENDFPRLDTVDQHIEVQLRRALSLIAMTPEQDALPAASSIITIPTLVPRASCAAPGPRPVSDVISTKR